MTIKERTKDFRSVRFGNLQYIHTLLNLLIEFQIRMEYNMRDVFHRLRNKHDRLMQQMFKEDDIYEI